MAAKYPRRLPGIDALRLKIRDEGMVKNKAAYLALGIDATSRKDVLGLLIEHTEGSRGPGYLKFKE